MRVLKSMSFAAGRPGDKSKGVTVMLNTDVAKSEWKHFKVVRESALERLCKRALTTLVAVASESSKTQHEHFLLIYSEIKDYDRQIAAGFDGLSRSRMIQQLGHLRSIDLLNDDELAGFTHRIQDHIAALASRD